MKLPQLFSFIFCLLIFFTFNTCKKDDNKTPVEQLPPETQTGANTFGCLVDGQVFIPKGDPFGGPIKKAQYQFVNGGYYLVISGSKTTSEGVSGVDIFSDSTLQLSVGIFNLSTYNANGKYSGAFVKIVNATINQYRTNEINLGQLIITKFDEANQIISGTFWFDAKNVNGEIMQIREGRFDMPYVR
jgi:hypothetical protein